VRFEPRTHRLRGWIIDFPSQVPRRLLDYPELVFCNVASKVTMLSMGSLELLLRASVFTVLASRPAGLYGP